MVSELDIASITHVIQTAVAPVFLLASISGLLAVITNRLNRIIDRTRTLEKEQLEARKKQEQVFDKEIKKLVARIRYINWSITFATISALLICMVVMSLFLGNFIGKSALVIIAVLFVTSMAFLIVALSLFLLEIMISTHSMRKGKLSIELTK